VAVLDDRPDRVPLGGLLEEFSVPPQPYHSLSQL
jgi:hypothetical protein